MAFKTLSQKDSKWKDIKLGTSRTTTIGSHGCTITCIAMLAGLTPKEVNERLLKVKGYANTNLVIWSKINEAIPWLKFTWRGYKYDNGEVLKAIKNNGACLVEVDFDNNVRTDGKHWVLFTGNQKQNDPWTGNVTPTNKYSLKTGYATIEVVGKPESDNMSVALKECLEHHTKLVTEAEKKDKQIAAQKGLVTKAEKKVEEAEDKTKEVQFDLVQCKLRVKELEKPKPVEAVKDPLRYVVSLLVGAVMTWAYTQYPFLGELGADQQAIATFIIGLIVKGLDKYQHESGSSLKLPF